jgi:hypothetical protein
MAANRMRLYGTRGSQLGLFETVADRRGVLELEAGRLRSWGTGGWKNEIS